MPRPDPAEVRAETLRFLYERKALPHQLSAVRSGLRRAGLDVEDSDVLEALDYLTSAGLADRRAGPYGGGIKSATWKINHLGTNRHEEES